MALATTAAYGVFGNAIVELMTQLPEVQDAATRYLPWAIAAPLVSVWAFVLDGIFIGTTRTAWLRNAMFGALLAYLATLWLSLDAFGNHAIWLSMMVFMLTRCILLGAYFPKLLRLAAVKARE